MSRDSLRGIPFPVIGDLSTGLGMLRDHGTFGGQGCGGAAGEVGMLRYRRERNKGADRCRGRGGRGRGGRIWWWRSTVIVCHGIPFGHSQVSRSWLVRAPRRAHHDGPYRLWRVYSGEMWG